MPISIKLNAFLLDRGFSTTAIDAINSSPNIVANLTRFEQLARLDVLIGADLVIPISARAALTLNAAEGTIAAFQQTDPTLPRINLTPSDLNLDPGTLALRLNHEAVHTRQTVVGYAAARNPDQYAVLRSINEGESQYDEWVARRELIAGGTLAPTTNSLADISLYEQFINTPLRAVLISQSNELYRELVRLGVSENSIRTEMTSLLARQNREFSRPSNEPLKADGTRFNYYEQDVRDFIAQALRIDQLPINSAFPDGPKSWSFLSAVPENAFQVTPDGKWSLSWNVPATANTPQTHYIRAIDGTQFKLTPTGLNGAWKISELEDSNGDGVPDRQTVFAAPVSVTSADGDPFTFTSPAKENSVTFSISPDGTGILKITGVLKVNGQDVVDSGLNSAMVSLNLVASDTPAGISVVNAGENSWRVYIPAWIQIVSATVVSFNRWMSCDTSGFPLRPRNEKLL
jgi:hypothetical protein